MELRAIAVSAPEYPFGRMGTNSLLSRDPASLYNACRYAAFLADNKLGVWGDSNWAIPRKSRKKNILLMNSLREEISYFEELLAKERPNLLLIGSMTMCFPGAIECAKLAKQMFGESILVVLGGRHANETIYIEKNGSSVKHHNGSPLKLIAENKIENVFDLVISGEGEFVISKIGEVVAGSSMDRMNAKKIFSDAILKGISETPGKWIAGRVVDGRIETLISKGNSINRDCLPSPVKMFGIETGFDIFQGALTGHVFSDMSSGCIHDCDFCSERSDVCGSLMQIETSSNRLFRQLVDVYEVVKEDSPGRNASAFVEDSIILCGLTSQLVKLDGALSDHPIDIEFGGQLTIDIAIKQKSLIANLMQKGFSYVFVGLETFNPSSIGGMNKDIGKNGWLTRAKMMVDDYTKMGMKIGVSVLFGLGESQNQRISLLRMISDWKKQYQNPQIISFNWAAQHPLRGKDNLAGYEYINWAIDDPEYVKIFRDYGEASMIYGIPGIKIPKIEELLELQSAIKSI